MPPPTTDIGGIMFFGRPLGRLPVRCVGPLTPQICIIFIEIPYFQSYVHHVAADMLVNLPTTRNSSGDEIATVNFLYDDIVHVLQNTIHSCINLATDRRGYVLERMCLPNSVK